MSSFTYKIGDTVFYLSYLDVKIKAGTIVGRKIIDAPNFIPPPSLTSNDYDPFDRKGNRLGRSCEEYEVETSGNGSLVLNVCNIFPDEEMLIEFLTRKDTE